MRSGPAGDFAIEAVQLAKRFGRTDALVDLSMGVPHGGVFGFLGPNGAGKTTAIKCFLGLTFPTSGDGRVFGRPFGDRAVRERIGYLPELFRFQDWLCAHEVLAFHLHLLGRHAREDRHAIPAALDRVGLGGRERDRVGGFSKGMQQRLGLAVALLGKPELLILDEPTSALDPLGRRDVRTLIEALRDDGMTILLNSHLLSEVERVCDRFVVIDRGRVVADGTLADLGGVALELRLDLGSCDREVRREGALLLARYGSVHDDERGLRINGVRREVVPEIVALLVRANIAVFGVELHAMTLEESFVALLEASHASDLDRVAHAR